jgi:hypothetical protein
MLIPKRCSYLLFGLIQSGLTCSVATTIASIPLFGEAYFAAHWFKSWMISWATMVPFVVLATPLIHRAVNALTREPG